MTSTSKRLYLAANDDRPRKRQRKEGETSNRDTTITVQEPECFRLLDLPNDPASRHLRTRVLRRVCELLLTESNNFIHVQKVQLMSLRFTRSTAIMNKKGEVVRPARHFQNCNILYLNRIFHREGWRIALTTNHFQFASLGILAEFLEKVGPSNRTKLRSLSMPLWREDDLTEGHMHTIATHLKACTKLRRIEVLTRCSRIGCPVATEDPDAEEHSGDRLIYDLGVMREIRKLSGPPKIELKVDCCILFTHGRSVAAEKHSHHDLLVKEANDWLNQPLEGPPSIAEVLGRPVPKAKTKLGRPRGRRSSRGAQRDVHQTETDVDTPWVESIEVSDDDGDSAIGMVVPRFRAPAKADDGDEEWYPDA